MLKFYKGIAVPAELNGSESLVLKIKEYTGILAVEMTF